MARRLVVLIVLGALAVGGGIWVMNRLSGRTPSSSVLREVYGDAVVFDRAYDGQGSSEDNTRVVVLGIAEDPPAVAERFSTRPGWRRLGKGATRSSDGLCLVPYSSEEYLEGPQQDVPSVRAATNGRTVVVVSLSYC